MNIPKIVPVLPALQPTALFAASEGTSNAGFWAPATGDSVRLHHDSGFGLVMQGGVPYVGKLAKLEPGDVTALIPLELTKAVVTPGGMVGDFLTATDAAGDVLLMGPFVAVDEEAVARAGIFGAAILAAKTEVAAPVIAAVATPDPQAQLGQFFRTNKAEIENLFYTFSDEMGSLAMSVYGDAISRYLPKNLGGARPMDIVDPILQHIERNPEGLIPILRQLRAKYPGRSEFQRLYQEAVKASGKADVLKYPSRTVTERELTASLDNYPDNWLSWILTEHIGDNVYTGMERMEMIDNIIAHLRRDPALTFTVFSNLARNEAVHDPLVGELIRLSAPTAPVVSTPAERVEEQTPIARYRGTDLYKRDIEAVVDGFGSKAAVSAFKYTLRGESSYPYDGLVLIDVHANLPWSTLRDQYVTALMQRPNLIPAFIFAAGEWTGSQRGETNAQARPILARLLRGAYAEAAQGNAAASPVAQNDAALRGRLQTMGLDTDAGGGIVIGNNGKFYDWLLRNVSSPASTLRMVASQVRYPFHHQLPGGSTSPAQMVDAFIEQLRGDGAVLEVLTILRDRRLTQSGDLAGTLNDFETSRRTSRPQTASSRYSVDLGDPIVRDAASYSSTVIARLNLLGPAVIPDARVLGQILDRIRVEKPSGLSAMDSQSAWQQAVAAVTAHQYGLFETEKTIANFFNQILAAIPNDEARRTFLELLTG